MPKGIPVATFAIGSAGAANAALFAVAMLAADDAGLRARLEAYRARQTDAARAMTRRAEVTRERGSESAGGATPSAAAASFIAPGATLGVLGGGQLGRMFVHAAQRDGLSHRGARPRPASPAGLVAHEHIRAAYLDPTASIASAERCAAITTEFENVPAAALARLAQRRPVAPSARGGRGVPGPRRREGGFARSDVACAPHAVIARARDIDRVDAALCCPAS